MGDGDVYKRQILFGNVMLAVSSGVAMGGKRESRSRLKDRLTPEQREMFERWKENRERQRESRNLDFDR